MTTDNMLNRISSKQSIFLRKNKKIHQEWQSYKQHLNQKDTISIPTFPAGVLTGGVTLFPGTV